MSRILIIDDEDTVRSLIQDMFGDNEHTFEQARDGATGVAMAEANPPTLVITDLMLPKYHGYEVIRKLRAFPATSKVPIVVLSAKVFTPDRKKALELGANDFLEKPFNLDELAAVIDKYCAKPATGGETIPPPSPMPAVRAAA